MVPNQLGRPPQAGITEALLLAAERVMTSEGYSGLSVESLVSEVGTTRPSFYRRFPSVLHLAFEVIMSHFGTGSPVNTGSLDGDLLALQREEIAMFSSPLMKRSLPGLLEAVRTDPDVFIKYRDGFVQPRRANVARLIAAAVQRGEITDSDYDIDFICDLLVGPMLARTLLPVNVGLDDTVARRTAQLTVDHLRTFHS